jgi:hypothetical protein
MYEKSDPRASLATSAASKPVAPTGFGRSNYARFYETEPQQSGPGYRSWLARGESFLVRFSETEAGASLNRHAQPDEYAVVVPDARTTLEIEWEGTRTAVPGYSVSFVPPGRSIIHVIKGGPIASFFTSRAADLAALCPVYQPDPNVPAIVDWPEPRGGRRVHSYSLEVPPEEGRFGKIFRGTTMMVNWLDPRNGPRDSKVLSPHDHDDFQQGSVVFGGDYVHHLRWPWTADGTLWRDDEHHAIGAPSIAFIPARVLHTSQAMGAGVNQMIDVFCPPRMDFSKKPGWVLNADDYPVPDEV